MLAAFLGIPKQSEILIIIFLGISFLSLDFSLFELKSNLQQIWKIELERSKYLETCLKYVISAVLLVRTFTLHAFLAFYIVMLWPAIFEEKPNLMLPWLLLGIIRCLIINGITFVVGLFICHIEKGVSPICFEYILAQTIEHGPSIYAWLSVLSFYRGIAGDHGSAQSSAESLLCSHEDGSITSTESQNRRSDDGTLDKTKSYSLSDLNMDYMYSNRVRTLQGEISIEVLIAELRDLFARKRIIRDGSKSFDSLIQANVSERPVDAGSYSNTRLTVREKTMKVLEVSDADIVKAKEGKDRFAQLLKDISVDDVKEMANMLVSDSFSSSKDKLHEVPKRLVRISHSQTEDVKSQETCLCYLRKQLQLEQSNQTLLESEIASVIFNEADKDLDNPDNRKWSGQKACSANKWKLSMSKLSDSDKCIDKDLNRYRVEAGYRFGFNPNVFLRKFVLKKNTSKNFGCQVSLLSGGIFEESTNQLVKKLVFLRNLAF